MTFSTIPEMFLNTTNNFADKYLYFYKKTDQWIGLKGKDIKNVVSEISAALKSLKIENQDKVAIMSNNSPRWAMSDYGILCSGNVTVTIYPTLVQSQVDYIINDSGSKLIFVENKIQMNKAIQSQENCDDLKYIIVMNDTYEGDNDNYNIILILYWVIKQKKYKKNHNS